MAPTADIIEIFSSIQGEGTCVGERHLFVRFQGCSLSCQFCDTPASFIKNPQCRVETIPFSKNFDYYDNPLDIPQLNRLLLPFQDEKVLSVTGGEPLEQVGFLKAWLPTLKRRYRILLETAGVHTEALSQILDWVDIVSMDFKLPSVSGMGAIWEDHRRFALAAQDKDLSVKVVVSSETEEDDLVKAAAITAAVDSQIPLILQPATPFAQFRDAPTMSQLRSWQQDLQQQLADVRIVPQLHKTLRVL